VRAVLLMVSTSARRKAGLSTILGTTGARRDRAERAAAAPPTVEPDPGNAGEGKVIRLPQSTRYDAVVIGAGLIGLACAWRAAKRGLSVLVVDEAERFAAGSSGVAAGMLAPVTEADFGEEPLLRVNLAGRERWPAFAAELEERTGLPTGYREGGALVVAADRDDAEALRRLHEFQRRLGLDVEWLTPGACRRLEPGLSPRIAGGIAAHGDAQADPRATARALAAAVDELALGVRVEAVEHSHGRVTGVRTAEGVVSCDSVVVAAGAWSAALAPEGEGPPVRPVKGQILELRARAGMDEPLTRIVRTPRCYLVARGDGRVMLGATVEEQGFDTAVTAGGVYRLLEAAWEVLPEVGELELVAAHAGLRPGTPDNRAVVGPGELEGLVWATGHWRNGVLLAPLTGDAVVQLLAEGSGPNELEPLSPARFAAGAAPRSAPSGAAPRPAPTGAAPRSAPSGAAPSAAASRSREVRA
jgi:glycine oxidase